MCPFFNEASKTDGLLFTNIFVRVFSLIQPIADRVAQNLEIIFKNFQF